MHIFQWEMGTITFSMLSENSFHGNIRITSNQTPLLQIWTVLQNHVTQAKDIRKQMSIIQKNQYAHFSNTKKQRKKWQKIKRKPGYRFSISLLTFADLGLLYTALNWQVIKEKYL